MKSLLSLPRWVRIVVISTVALVLLGFGIRKPVLIAYHRSAMINTWQTHIGLPRQSGWLGSFLQSVGLAPAPAKSFTDPNAMSRVFQHRAALVRLGFLAERRFVLSPVSVASEDYKQLCIRVAAETGQQPTAQFEYDVPASPSVVSDLTVYAIAEEMPRWEQFVEGLTKRHD